MRIGMNPLAEVHLPPLPPVVAAVVTHLPHREGYHAQRFEVVQRCLESLGREIPLYIWDNGSDAEFRDWLQWEMKPDFLTFSGNIGKAAARTAMLRTFPSATVVCYSDDDILFNPGWLQAHLELLEGFPNVGCVSGCPIRTQFRWGNTATLKWAHENAELKVGRYIPDEWDYDFCRSIGRDYAYHLEESARDLDYLIEYHGMRAYATAHHMQFIGYAGKLGAIGLWPSRAMRMEQTFDVAVDQLGLLRLTTTERYTRHLGNILEREDANLRV